MAISSPLRYSALSLRSSVLILTLAAVVGCSNTAVDYQQGAETALTATTQWQY